jgi:glyoxylase-like metal-dependent hydrolase (beta-lactamase superfamily II)
MLRRILIVSATIAAIVLALVLRSNSLAEKPEPAWSEIVPGIWRTTAMPYSYALTDGDAAVVIDAGHSPAGFRTAAKIDKVELVLLTHHHLDSCALAADYIKQRIPVRAAKASIPWLAPAEVKKFWLETIPLRNSRTAYFVLPEGIAGIDCTLEDGQTIAWRGWSIQVVATPGHSRDHLSFLATRDNDKGAICFCGDALAAPGKLWAPFTTDWDHWTDAGLSPTVQSLRKLAASKPRMLLPAHGEPIRRDPVEALELTAAAVEEMAFLKSFERFSKQRLGQPPTYPFLVPKEQVASGGDKPWARVSEHLWITGNTYVLVSKEDKAFAVLDPWGKRSVDQIAKLQREQQLGKLELVMFSHAHYDHYDGVYDLPGYSDKKFAVWSLDLVADPLASPLDMRAPFLDARPVCFDRLLKDGESAAWREYRFRFHHLPGQSLFTMGMEAVIDGKRCYFTADNFFHQDQFSGTGGWMGLNRSFPGPYAASAKKVLDAAPEWILAEHGGPYVYSAVDYRRRVQWGEVSAKSADAICLSGHHPRDWDPYRVQARPLLQKAKSGADCCLRLCVTGTHKEAEDIVVSLNGRGILPNQSWLIKSLPGRETIKEVTLRLTEKLPAGRHVFPLQVRDVGGVSAVDAFFAVEVE